MDFCASSGEVAELEKQFAAASISHSSERDQQRLRPPSGSAPGDGNLHKNQAQTTSPSSSAATTSPQAELQTITHAMRKLREAIVATGRCDVFAQRAYVFLIRACILVRHLESYHPALLYLLRKIHPVTALPASELREFVGYRILDLCCRQGDLHEAYLVRWRHSYRDRRVDKVLNSLVHDDWVVFWRMQRTVDGHQRALMEWAAQGMRTHTLKCLGRTYFTAEKAFVESCTALDWQRLVETCNVGWELEGEKVTIRRPKVK